MHFWRMRANSIAAEPHEVPDDCTGFIAPHFTFIAILIFLSLFDSEEDRTEMESPAVARTMHLLLVSSIDCFEDVSCRSSSCPAIASSIRKS
jgi:hypothetical protein